MESDRAFRNTWFKKPTQSKKSADEFCLLSSHNLKLCNRPLGGFINLWFKVSETLSWLLPLMPQNLFPQLKAAKSYSFRAPASLSRPSFRLFFFNSSLLAAHLSAILLFLNSNTACPTNSFSFSTCYSNKSAWWRSDTMTWKNLLRTDPHINWLVHGKCLLRLTGWNHALHISGLLLLSFDRMVMDNNHIWKYLEVLCKM